MSIVQREVSVVVSTYSQTRVTLVLKCIESLNNQTLRPSEIILALDPDQGLIDFYKERTPSNVKIIASEGYGLSYSRNAGVKRAKGDIVSFIDDDAVADPRWLESLAKNYADPDVVSAGGQAKPVWEAGRPSWFPAELDWVVGCSYRGLPEKRTLVRNVIGCNMSFRRNIFGGTGYFGTNVGRFGKKLLAGEEAEFSSRIRQRMPTAKIAYDPAAVVYHRVSRERKRLVYLTKRSFYEGLSKATIQKMSRFSPIILSTEEQYLHYLLAKAIPSRFERPYTLEKLCQALVLLVSTLAVIAGYIVGLTIRDYT